MRGSDEDIREIDAAEFKVLCDHGYMKVWDAGDGRIVRVGNCTHTPELARSVCETYAAAFQGTSITPRPFEVVRVGDRFGVVVEYVQGLSLGVYLGLGLYSPREAGEALAEAALRTHSAHVRAGRDMRALYLSMAKRVVRHLPDDQSQRLIELIQAIPVQDTFLHGDIHPGNVIVGKDALRLIDMDSAGFGHPVFDLACMKAVVFRGAPYQAGALGMTAEEGVAAAESLWRAVLNRYFAGRSEDDVSNIAIRIDILAQLAFCYDGPVFLDEGSVAGRRLMAEGIESFKGLLNDALPGVEQLDF